MPWAAADPTAGGTSLVVASSQSLQGNGAYAPVTAPIAQADGDIWYLAAESQIEKDAWVGFFKRSLALIRRCDDTRPTLSGMGTIHDHYIIGRVLGVGRFGVGKVGGLPSKPVVILRSCLPMLSLITTTGDCPALCLVMRIAAWVRLLSQL